MTEQQETEAKQMNNITAFTKHPEIVESHEAIPGASSEPVLVVAINSNGAWGVTQLPPGEVTVYDFREYDEEEVTQYEHDGFHEVEPDVFVEAFRKVVSTVQIPRVETYAVVTTPKEEATQDA